MHNGAIREFPRVKRELAFAVDPDSLRGDRGVDRLGALLLPRAHARARGRPTGRRRPGGRLDRGGRTRHGVEHPIQMTVATTDGDSVWAFRYSSEGASRTLFFSTSVAHAEGAVPGQPRPARALGRVAAGRVGAARRPQGRLERGAGVELGCRPGGRRRAAPVRARASGIGMAEGYERDASGRSRAAPSRKQIAPRNVPAFASATSSSSPVSGTT